MGIMTPKIEGTEAQKAIAKAQETIAKEIGKPWYKKPEWWGIIIAIILAIIGWFI